MNKTTYVKLFFSLLFISNVYADSYRGMLTAPTAGGRDGTFMIDIKYEADASGNVHGTFKSLQSKQCNGDRTMTGSIKNDTLEFATDMHELKGCGRQKFVGKKEGDSWVGHMNFNGGLREITFKKTID